MKGDKSTSNITYKRSAISQQVTTRLDYSPFESIVSEINNGSDKTSTQSNKQVNHGGYLSNSKRLIGAHMLMNLFVELAVPDQMLGVPSFFLTLF